MRLKDLILFERLKDLTSSQKLKDLMLCEGLKKDRWVYDGIEHFAVTNFNATQVTVQN